MTLAPTQPRHSALFLAVTAVSAPIARAVSGRRFFPFYAILRHTGRTSGKHYATPVVARPIPGGFLIPLPFGDATQWAKNMLASGGATIRYAGREHEVADPAIVDLDEVAPQLSGLVRSASRRAGIKHYVRVRTLDA